MPFVIFDTEYTSWEGCLKKGWTGNQKKEIVQISAIKVSDSLNVIDTFTALCKPVFNPILSDYFINLTNISNAQIEKEGKPFKEIFTDFIAFAGNNICYSHGWGSAYFNKSDGEILDENLRLYKLPISNSLTYRNIAPIFKHLYLKNNISVESQSSGQIVEILNLKQKLKNLELNPHNSLYDVYSILEGLKYFYPKSVELLNAFEADLSAIV